MLILKMTYEQFDEKGEFIGDYTLTPVEGNIEFPDHGPKDLSKLAHTFLQRAYGETIAEHVYGKKQCHTMFSVKWKEDPTDGQSFTHKFLVTPHNYKIMLGLV